MSAITIESVSKSYGTTPVLHALDLEIPDGAFVSFLGPVRLREEHPALLHRRP